MSKILTYPHAVLRKTTVSVIGDSDAMAALPGLQADLHAAMLAEDGVGIAAPQIGVTQSVYLIRGVLEEDTAGIFTLTGDPHGTASTCFVSPDAPEATDAFERVPEGCLSFPTISVYVERAMAVSFRSYVYPTHMTSPVLIRAYGLYAQAVQHEDDHLYGVLLVDYATRVKYEAIKKKLIKLAKAKAVKAHTR